MTQTTTEAHGYSEKKDPLINRLRRIEGQVRGIAKMIDEDKYCIDVLTQISAVTSALQSVALGLLDEHLGHCVSHAVAEGGADADKKLAEAFAKIRPYIATFDNTNYLTTLPNSEICAVNSWSGDYGVAKKRAADAGIELAVENDDVVGRLDPANIEPNLAESWTVSPDGKTYKTFAIPEFGPHIVTVRLLPNGIYRQLMLDRLASLAGVESRSIEAMVNKSAPAPQPAVDSAPPDYDYPLPPEGDFSPPSASHRQAAPFRQPAARQKQEPRSPGLKAIELLLYKPEVALGLDKDLEPLRENGDQYTDLLLELIELTAASPTTNTYTMLGHCYGTPLGNQLTLLMKNEKITPLEGVASEFHYLMESLLADAKKKQFKKQLIEQLKPRLRSGNTDG